MNALPFTLPRFLLSIPHSLIEKYFQNENIPIDSALCRTLQSFDTLPFLSFWESLPGDIRKNAYRSFADIFELATGTGQQTLVQTASLMEKNILSTFSVGNTPLENSFRMFLEHPTVFYQALNVHSIRQNQWRYFWWGVPQSDSVWDSATKSQIEWAFKEYFFESSWRKVSCSIEQVQFDHSIHYFYTTFQDEFPIEHFTMGNTFEIVFIYDKVERIFEVHGDEEQANLFKLGTIFLKEYFNWRVIQSSNAIMTNLTAIVWDRRPLIADPDDRLEIKLKRVQLCLNGSVLIQLETNDNEISPLSSNVVNWHRFDRYQTTVTGIYLKFSFMEQEPPRGNSFIVHLASNTCRITGTYDLELWRIVSKYFTKWEKYHERPLENFSQSIGN